MDMTSTGTSRMLDLHVLDELQSALARHGDVGQHQVGRAAFDGRQRLHARFPTSPHTSRSGSPVDQLGQAIPRDRMVIHHKDAPSRFDRFGGLRRHISVLVGNGSRAPREGTRPAGVVPSVCRPRDLTRRLEVRDGQVGRIHFGVVASWGFTLPGTVQTTEVPPRGPRCTVSAPPMVSAR